MGWSAAKAVDDAVAAARDRAAMARMVRELLRGMVCLLGRTLGDAPCGFGSGSLALEWGVRAQGDYRAAGGLNQDDLVIGNPRFGGFGGRLAGRRLAMISALIAVLEPVRSVVRELAGQEGRCCQPDQTQAPGF